MLPGTPWLPMCPIILLSFLCSLRFPSLPSSCCLYPTPNDAFGPTPPTVSTRESGSSSRRTSHVVPFLKLSFGPRPQRVTKKVPNHSDKPNCYYSPAVRPFFFGSCDRCIHVIEKRIAKSNAMETQITRRVSVSSSAVKGPSLQVFCSHLSDPSKPH